MPPASPQPPPPVPPPGDSLHHRVDAQALLRMLEVSRQLAAPSELNDLLTAIIEAGRHVLSADRGSVFLYDARAKELYTSVATGGVTIRFSIEKGIVGEAARNRHVIVVNDCYSDPRFNPDIDKQTGYRTQCLISVPLIGLEDELVGVLQMLNAKKGLFNDTDVEVAQILGSQAAVAIQRTRLIEEHMVKVKMERDLALARQIQLNVLPKSLPACPGYSLAVFSQPADETGGDIYDVIDLSRSPESGVQSPESQRYGSVTNDSGLRTQDSGLLFVLADATGHGIGPALSVTQFRAMLRIGMRLSAGLDAIITQINEQLALDLPAGRFVTAFVGILDPPAGRLTYHAAGQGPLAHYCAATGITAWIGATMPPLGIDCPTEPSAIFDLAPGDVVALLTDGFFEYQNEAGEQFGEDRASQVLAATARQDAPAILDALVRAVREFGGQARQLDDLTGIVVKRI